MTRKPTIDDQIRRMTALMEARGAFLATQVERGKIGGAEAASERAESEAILSTLLLVKAYAEPLRALVIADREARGLRRASDDAINRETEPEAAKP